MNDRLNHMLRMAEEFGDWDKLILSCDDARGMTDEEKGRAGLEIGYLRQVLGEGFLWRAIAKGHPIYWHVINTTRSSRLWFISVAEALKELSGAGGFRGVFKKFKEPDKSMEAESVLNVALRLKRAGFDITFEPQVTVTQQNGQRKQKRPDLSLVDEETGEEVVVEVSILERSAAHRDAFDISHFFIPLLNEVDSAKFKVDVELKEGFDGDYVGEAVRLLREMAEEVERTGEFKTLVNDRMAAGVAPAGNVEQLRQWGEENGISPGVTGPPIWSDEISRARMKIRDKLAQLPEDRPGVIVIPTTGSMMFHFYDLLLIIRVLQEEVSRYPRLWGVVLLHDYVGGAQGETVITRLGPSTLVDKARTDVFREQTAILLNEACALPVSHVTGERLLGAFV
jgi:hypothetical protein